MNLSIKTLSLGMVAGSLLFSACGKKAEEATVAAEVTIPEAPDAAMKTILSELADGNGGILWKAMPASYQGDVNTIVQLAGNKIDAEMYDKTFSIVGRLGDVIGKQKEFILGTSLDQRSPEDQAKIEQALPIVVEFVKTICNSKIASSMGLQSFDGQQFFDTTISELTKLTVELSKLSNEAGQPNLDDLRNAVITVVESTDTEATLTFAAPGQAEETERFTKVENRWVPADMAAEWTQGVGDAITKLEAVTVEEVTAMKPQVMGVLTMIDGVLTQIEAAETQEQFDQALQGAMMPLMGLMMMGQGMGTAPAGAMPAPGLPTAP